MSLSEPTFKLILASAADKETIDKVRSRIENFKVGRSTALVVAMGDIAPADLGPGVVHWKMTLSSEDEYQFQVEAYNRLRRLLETVGVEFLDALTSHRILLTQQMVQALTASRLMTSHLSVCLILSAHGISDPVVEVDLAQNEHFPFSALREVQRDSDVVSSPDAKKRQSPKKVAINLLWKVARFVRHPQMFLNALSENQKVLREIVLQYVDTFAKQGRRYFSSKVECILLPIEDSGTWLNLTPGLELCKSLHTASTMPLVLTSSDFVKRVMGEHGFMVRKLGSHNLTSVEVANLKPLVARLVEILDSQSSDAVDELFVAFVQPRLLSWFRDTVQMRNELIEVNKTYRVKTTLTVGTATPITILAGTLGQRIGARWIVYFPVILNPHIELSDPGNPAIFSPADTYLTYGEQLRDQLITLGLNASSVRTVGSVTFDLAIGGDHLSQAEKIRMTVARRWPLGWKLVVVGTECLPNPFEEIEVVVRSLLDIPNVYVIIKVHPSDNPDVFRRYVNKLGADCPVEVVAACDLNALLSAADLLVCIVSNIIVTAAVVGTPTLVCDFSNKRAPVDYCREGLCLGCFDPAKVPDVLNLMLKDSEMRDHAYEMLKTGIRRFNGLNDGASGTRVAMEVVGAL